MNCSIGDTVVYGGNGVCKVDAIQDIRMGHERPQKYYVLKTLFVRQTVTVFVPINNEKLMAKIQPVISKEEALDLIDTIEPGKGEWIEDRNERKTRFSEMLSSADRREIISLISIISKHRDELAKDGKSLNMQDEKYLTDATHRINSEFAVALDMNIEDVPGFIREKIG